MRICSFDKGRIAIGVADAVADGLKRGHSPILWRDPDGSAQFLFRAVPGTPGAIEAPGPPGAIEDPEGKMWYIVAEGRFSGAKLVGLSMSTAWPKWADEVPPDGSKCFDFESERDRTLFGFTSDVTILGS